MEGFHRRPTLIAAMLILAASLAGMLLVGYATSRGPGVGGDATIYLLSAENLLAGNGLGWMEPGGFHRLDYYPPFFPLAVSGMSLFVGDVVAAARWLNMLLFGSLIALSGAWLYHATHRPLLTGMLSGMLAASPVLIRVFSWAMAEALFLLTGFAGLALLAADSRRPRVPVLLGAALLSGLAFLSRYLGIAFVISGALLILVSAPGASSFAARLRRGMIYSAVALLPMAAWLITDFIASGTIGGRSSMPGYMFLPRLFGMLPALESIVLFWLMPESLANRLPGILRSALFGLSLAALLGLCIAAWRGYARTKSRSGGEFTAGAWLAGAVGIFIVVYLVVLAALQAVIHPPVAIDLRMLAPVHIAGIVLVFALAHLGLGLFARGRRSPAVALLVVGAVVLGSYMLRGVSVAREYHQTGIGYTAPAWRQSDTIKAARVLPETTPLISNDRAALMFLLGRPAYGVAEIYQDQPEAVFSRYGSGADIAQRVFREQGGALVLLDASLQEDFAMYGERIAERLATLTDGLYLYYRGDDGAIYFYHAPVD